MARRMPARLVRNVMPVTVPVVGFWPCQALMKSSGRMGAVRESTQVRASTGQAHTMSSDIRYHLQLGVLVMFVCWCVCVCVCVSYKGAAATEEGQDREPMRVRFHCCQQGTRVFRFSHTSQSPPQKIGGRTKVTCEGTALFFNHLYSSIVYM